MRSPKTRTVAPAAGEPDAMTHTHTSCMKRHSRQESQRNSKYISRLGLLAEWPLMTMQFSKTLYDFLSTKRLTRSSREVQSKSVVNL